MTRRNFTSAAVAIIVILLSQIGWETWSGRWDYAPFHGSVNTLYKILTSFICHWVKLILDTFPNIHYVLIENVFHFCDGRIVGVSNGCSGLKQYFHFSCLILCSLNGSLTRRACYMIFGIVILINFNVLRISVLCVVMQQAPDYWEFFHATFFRFTFYVVILLLWILWESR